MDAAPPAEVIQRIRALVAEHADGAIEAHDLRTRHAGRLTFLEFHLVVPGTMTVAESHAICDRIEAALKAEMSTGHHHPRRAGSEGEAAGRAGAVNRPAAGAAGWHDAAAGAGRVPPRQLRQPRARAPLTRG